MEPHRLALPSGFRIENYEIQAVLGKGGFGITYIAYDWTLKRHMAIKELLPDTIATRIEGSTVVAMGPAHEEGWAWARERFVEEAQILAGFRHPNIIAVHRLIEANGTVYMVMDHLEGESYETRLRRIGAEPDQTSLMAVIGPILDGLQEVHAKGLLHRDIKPENILFDGRGNAVLIDFGAARATVGATMTMTSIVTHGYSPIEQYQTKGKMGPWTDIYAMAAVMYRAITGKKPPVAAERIEADDYQPLSNGFYIPEYSATFLNAIDWALNVKSGERPQGIQDWKVMLENKSETHKPAKQSNDLTAIPSRNVSPRTAAIIALLGLFGLSFAAYTIYIYPQKQLIARLSAENVFHVSQKEKLSQQLADANHANTKLSALFEQANSDLESEKRQHQQDIEKYRKQVNALEETYRKQVDAVEQRSQKPVMPKYQDAANIDAANAQAAQAAGRSNLKISITPSTNSPKLGDYLQMYIRVDGIKSYTYDVKIVDLPLIIMGRECQVSVQGHDMRRLHEWSQTIVITIKLDQVGPLVVPSVPVEIEGIRLKTHPVYLTVTD